MTKSFRTKEEQLEHKRAYNRERSKKWRAENPGKGAEASKKCRDKDPEKAKRIRIAYKEKHKEKYNEYSKQYNQRLDQRFKKSINAAKKRKKDWTLTFEEFCLFASQPCTYCNDLLGHTTKGSGLDRLDNKKGYHIDNVCSSCGFCNKLRSDRLTHEETKEIIHYLLIIRKLINE